MSSLVLAGAHRDPRRAGEGVQPLLEKLAAENVGRWVLARVDVEVNQQIAQALRVQNVPALYAIFQGQPVAVVPGIATEQQLREWLVQLMEALAQYLPPARGGPRVSRGGGAAAGAPRRPGRARRRAGHRRR